MSFETIVKFVERKMSIDDFLECLYNDKELEKILSEDITLRPFTYLGETAYLYLLNQNMKTPGGMLNALSALEEFLEKKQIGFEKNDAADKLFSLMQKIQPNWLDIPDWYMEKILAMSGGKKGKDMEAYLKERIRNDFRCSKKQPKWIQSAQWVFVKGEPIVFVGQIDIAGIMHDTAQLYVFYDEQNNEYHFIEQTL